MEWEHVVGEATYHGCWVRYLGVDLEGRHHACAGPLSLLAGLSERFNFNLLDPTAAEQLPLVVIAELELPTGTGDNRVEAGRAALARLWEIAPEHDEATGELRSWHAE